MPARCRRSWGAQPGAGELRAEGAPSRSCPASPLHLAQLPQGDLALLTVPCPFCINTQRYSFLAKITSSSVLFLMADFRLLPPRLAEQH